MEMVKFERSSSLTMNARSKGGENESTKSTWYDYSIRDLISLCKIKTCIYIKEIFRTRTAVKAVYFKEDVTFKP